MNDKKELWKIKLQYLKNKQMYNTKREHLLAIKKDAGEQESPSTYRRW